MGDLEPRLAGLIHLNLVVEDPSSMTRASLVGLALLGLSLGQGHLDPTGPGQLDLEVR